MRVMLRVLTILIVGFLLVTVAAGVSAQRAGGDPKARSVKNPVASTSASITAGRTVYTMACRHCHGLRGKGDGPVAPKNPKPADLTDDMWDHGSSDGEIFAVIWNGAPEPSEMKGMKTLLQERDVWNVVNFIRSIGPKPAATK
jgi:mono/diheme cytochrome c family protein